MLRDSPETSFVNLDANTILHREQARVNPSWHRECRTHSARGDRGLIVASNILFLPFRKTHPVSPSEAIKQYISSKYDQHPDMFKQDLEEIDKLRNAAVNALEPHASGIRKIQAYAAQLVWMGGKFPIDVGQTNTILASKLLLIIECSDRSRFHVVCSNRI